MYKGIPRAAGRVKWASHIHPAHRRAILTPCSTRCSRTPDLPDLGGFKKIIRPLDFCTMAASPQGGSPMELSPEMRSWLMETARSFHGAQRRRFMAQTVQALGLSQRQVALALGWARDTVRKGLHELHSGIA